MKQHCSINAPQSGLNIDFKKGLERVRKPINRSQKWKRVKATTFKSTVRDKIHCECEAEYVFLHILECDCSVFDYCEQPAKIKFIQDGEVKTHYPDYLVEQDFNKSKFIEVKNNISDVTTEVFSRTKILQETLPLIGYEYELIVVSEIDDVLKANCKWIYDNARRVIRPIEFENFNIFNSLPSFKNFDLHEQPYIARYVLQGLLHIEWEKKITINSLISTTSFGEIAWIRSI